MNLSDSVENLKGIGPKTAETLKKAGIKTLRDFFIIYQRITKTTKQPTLSLKFGLVRWSLEAKLKI